MTDPGIEGFSRQLMGFVHLTVAARELAVVWAWLLTSAMVLYPGTEAYTAPMHLVAHHLATEATRSVAKRAAPTPFSHPHVGQHNGSNNQTKLHPSVPRNMQEELHEQSPIDIKNVEIAWLDRPFQLSPGWNETPSSVTVKNTGHSVELKFRTRSPIIITGGHLGSTQYYFQELHWHWGENMSEGSEHELGTRKFPLEGHFHFRAEGSQNRSQNEGNNKIAVIGVLYEPSVDDNHVLLPTTSNTEMLVDAYSFYVETDYLHPLDDYLPTDGLLHPYFSYRGSLTTEPYTEAEWMVLSQRSCVSSNQVAAFRKVKDVRGNNIVKNFRPIQRLEGRYPKLYMGVSNTDESHVK